MENHSVTNVTTHQQHNGVLDSEKPMESDVEFPGTASNGGSDVKEEEEPSPRQIHGIKVRFFNRLPI